MAIAAVPPPVPMRVGEWSPLEDEVDARGFPKWELHGFRPVVLLVISETANPEERDGWFDVVAVTHDGRRFVTDFSNAEIGRVFANPDGGYTQVIPHGRAAFCLQWLSEGHWESL